MHLLLRCYYTGPQTSYYCNILRGPVPTDLPRVQLDRASLRTQTAGWEDDVDAHVK
jgi:hypothetical protein